jgi:hypothetical protein
LETGQADFSVSTTVEAIPEAKQDVSLFVSYNHQDRDAVNALCSELQQYGLRLFLDSESLRPAFPGPKRSKKR